MLRVRRILNSYEEKQLVSRLKRFASDDSRLGRAKFFHACLWALEQSKFRKSYIVPRSFIEEGMRRTALSLYEILKGRMEI